MKLTNRHPVDEIPPLRRLVPLSLQHVMVMVATPLSSVFLVSKTLGLSESLTTNLLSATFILSGLGTLLQSFGPWKIGAKLPFVMLPGGAPIIMFLMIAKQHGLQMATGAVILTGVFYFLVLPLFTRLLRFFPTVVVGTMIVVIGVNLVQVSAFLITGQPGSKDFGNLNNLGLGIATIGFIVLFYRLMRNGLRQVAVLLGMLAGTVLGALLGMANFSGVGTGSILALPQFLPFGPPQFDILASLPLLIFSIASMAEATGQTILNGEIVGKDIVIERDAPKTIRGDAIMSLFGGLFGTSLIVTSGENIGIVQATGVRTRFVTVGAGVILIVIGVLAPVGRLMAGIPSAVIGATAVIVFSIIIAMGFRMLRRVDFNDHRNTIIAAIALAAGLMPILVPGMYAHLPVNASILLGSGVAMTAFVGALTNFVFHHLGRRTAPNTEVTEISHEPHEFETALEPQIQTEGTR
ncbi:uracil-xanthine permease family protein [Specibacter cremeus]|uniref:uracil-xanthine permease family protein n=1 Tax=Specibacter cremeus TaxID=1629051 RepID=UPI000F79F98C|nr:uracil-xanthine permease family protein [Specibacter cremeus]